MNLEVREFKKGDKLSGIYGMGMVAGDDIKIASAYGIHADLFDMGEYYQCPNVLSENQGSGNFLEFLKELKSGMDKPVYFVNITNQHLYKYLSWAGIGVKAEDGNFYEVRLRNEDE